MAEDPDARRGCFARSMMRAATMDNPPAAIHALAEAARARALAPVAGTGDALRASELIRGEDVGGARQRRTGVAAIETAAQWAALKEGLKRKVKEKRDKNATAKRRATMLAKIHERGDEMRAAAEATQAPTLRDGGADRGDEGDPVSTVEAPTTKANDDRLQRAVANRLLDSSPNRGFNTAMPGQKQTDPQATQSWRRSRRSKTALYLTS